MRAVGDRTWVATFRHDLFESHVSAGEVMATATTRTTRPETTVARWDCI